LSPGCTSRFDADSQQKFRMRWRGCRSR
jgi:hypothetical protein